MSKIDELLAELCPDGVVSSRLGEVCTPFSGFAFNSEFFNSRGDGLPLIRIRDVNSGNSGTFYAGVFQERFLVRDGDILIGMDGNFSCIEWDRGPGLLNQRVSRLQDFSPSVIPRFMYFLMQIEISKLNIGREQSTVAHISGANIRDIEVPVPPLEVQREIVSILDKFTQLEAELEAELEARKSQFTYFVDRIFDLDGSHNAPSEPLKSACRITRASGLEKSQLQGEGLPVVQYGEIHMHYDTVATSSRSFADPLIAGKLQRANPGDVILVTTSEDVKDVGNPLVWLGPTPIGVGGESLIMEHDLDPVYLGMFFKSNSFYSQKLPYVNGSKVKRISTSNLQKILIPVPERGVQKMLGDNLLALENLVKSASVGLPAEIAARRKQYEYYRNKLLAFKELETA
jgi:type I restriction enzyme S subunit